jgi:TPR repeat protein
MTKHFLLLLLLMPFLCQAQDMGDLGDPVQTAIQEHDYFKAFDRAREGAEKGDAKAQGDLGLMYQKGLGTDPDMKKAAYWLGKAARRGDASAENNLGSLFVQGDGVKQDYDQARQWFEKAAAQGSTSAQFNLGLLYHEGFGVTKDPSKAFDYFHQAANQDDVDAEVALGMLYSLGEGVEKDYPHSYFWFHRALGHEVIDEDKRDEVRDDIQWLEKHMSNRDINFAKSQKDDWVTDRDTPAPSPKP